MLRWGRSAEKSPSKWRPGADLSIPFQWNQREHTEWKAAQNKVEGAKMAVPFHSNQENYQVFEEGGAGPTKKKAQILEALSWE